MVKTWSADNPKAGLMARKRAAIVAAAQKAFLESGYAGASVNEIAADAGVSIKTLYRHFESKDDLFSAVMQAACTDVRGGPVADMTSPAWYELEPAMAFPMAGAEYLRHILSADQLALYRVVCRDAVAFPELGKRYLVEMTTSRDTKFVGYLKRWEEQEGWRVENWEEAARIFAGLLKAGMFDAALFEPHLPTEKEIAQQAAKASIAMLKLLAD